MQLTSHKVLIVEDEPLVALLLEDMLIDLGHQVIRISSTLAEGLRAIHELELSLAVIDVNLQGEMSFPIAQAAYERGIPVLFSTGFGQGSMSELRKATVLAKPYTYDELAHAIEAATKSGSGIA